jgi:hypothetical protein
MRVVLWNAGQVGTEFGVPEPDHYGTSLPVPEGIWSGVVVGEGGIGRGPSEDCPASVSGGCSRRDPT